MKKALGGISKMKKVFGLVALLAFSTLPVFSQGFSEGTTPKVEVGGGYGFRSWGAPAAGNGRTNMNGWAADANYNLNRMFGIAFDAAGTGQTVTSDGFTYTQRITTSMAGPRLFPVGRHKLTPFIHVMAGLGRYSLYFPGEDYRENHLAIGFGGGVDAAVNRMIAVRLLQLDYERTVFTLDQAFPAQNNLRFSAGVIFRFGGR
jgi:hypothetical protein